MGLVATKKGEDFELTPEGVHVARCYRVVDLGTQSIEYMGQQKKQHKVLISWEILGDTMMVDGRPFSMNQRYTVSTHQKAVMRQHFEQWRGRKFSDGEIAKFEIKNVAGAYCLLNVVHSDKDGMSYANVASIMPLPKGMPKMPGVNPIQIFDLDDRDMALFATFGDRLKETIIRSDEWAPKSVAHDMADDIPWKEGATAQGIDLADVPF